MAMSPNRVAHQQIDELMAATHEIVNRARALYVRSTLMKDFGLEQPDLDQDRKRFLFAAKGLEAIGLDVLSRSRDPEIIKRAWKELLWSAFRLRRSITRGESSGFRHLTDVVIDGLLANRQPELRLALGDIPLDKPMCSPDEVEWADYVLDEVLRAFLLLVRKAGGLRDLQMASEVISSLRDLQKRYEERYLNWDSIEPEQKYASDKQESALTERDRILELRAALIVGYYNLARAIEVTGEYLKGDYEHKDPRYRLTAQGVKDEVDRFIFTAREVLSGKHSDIRLLAGRLGAACKSLIDASVYSAVLPRRSKQLLTHMAQRADRPVLELWYAQREALQCSLLDPTRLAVVISMPTSAGKTLLAELAILQANYDDPEGRIVYLAPTRALVTQVSLTLRRDLGKELRVRVATPSFELNPIEDEILEDDFDILVTTPEKMDLLVRVDHKAVQRLSLVVVDEAHNLQDGDRGARVELLLATLRRERPGTRFLLLSPFANNAKDISRWLGGDQGAPIVIDWKPNDRVVGVIAPGNKRRGSKVRPIQFETLDSAQSDCPAGQIVPIGEIEATSNPSKKQISLHAVLTWAQAKNGGVLLLAQSREDAVERATSLASMMTSSKPSPSVDFVCRYLDTEAGGPHPLSALLRKGVAFHHAGLSTEARYLIERLAEEGAVKILCATTTLAQGVHFPLSVAMIESHYQYVRDRRGRVYKSPMQPSVFWNIAGRVGRTLEDPLGIIAFVSAKPEHKRKIEEYLTQDASRVSSALMALLRATQGRPVTFSTYLVETVSAASAFLQYILHALSVSGSDAVKRDLEGIIRASFVYEQARMSNPDLADELIRIARLYLEDLEKRKGQALSGFARMADATGFSSPSVDVIWGRWKDSGDPDQKIDDWSADRVFPRSKQASPLMTRVIDTLKDLPEIKLGTETSGLFNAERIARIVSAWVNGSSLTEIAQEEYKGDLLSCTHHIYSTVTNLIPWGLRAIERVVFAGLDDSAWKDLDLLPAMVFHGVRTREAIALRMRGVPRVVAETLATQYRNTGAPKGKRVSEWLDSSTEEAWEKALPPNAQITGRECRLLWEVLEGTKTWKEAFVSR